MLYLPRFLLNFPNKQMGGWASSKFKMRLTGLYHESWHCSATSWSDSWLFSGIIKFTTGHEGELYSPRTSVIVAPSEDHLIVLSILSLTKLNTVCLQPLEESMWVKSFSTPSPNIYRKGIRKLKEILEYLCRILDY